jgi:hypothetical protein
LKRHENEGLSNTQKETICENAKKIRPANKDLCDMRTTVYVAQKMGENLGRRALLQRCLPVEEASGGGETLTIV